MSKKNKQKSSSSQQNVDLPKDTFNVKENLKKIKSGTNKERYETDTQINNAKNEEDGYYASDFQSKNSEFISTSTSDRFEKINDKFSSDFSTLKDTIHEHKEKVSEKLSEKVSVQELRYWIAGLIGGVGIMAGIIYTLSYQVIICDIKEIKEEQKGFRSDIDKINFKIENEEKTMPNNIKKAVNIK